MIRLFLKFVCIGFMVSSCISTELTYKFNRHDFDEKRALYHHQKLGDFQQSKKVVDAYWVKIPDRQDPLKMDYDTIVTVNIDSVINDKEGYKAITYVLDKTNIEDINIVLYKAYSKKNYGVYLYHSTSPNMPFQYAFVFKYPSKAVIVKRHTRKTGGNLSCEVLLDNLEWMLKDMGKNNVGVNKKDIVALRKILNNAASKNVAEWNSLRVDTYEEKKCLE